MTLQETSSNQRSSPVQPMRFGHNSCINFNINFDLEFSKIKDRANVQNSKDPSVKIHDKKLQKPMEQIASDSNDENTHA
jgi:hypothetical protein